MSEEWIWRNFQRGRQDFKAGRPEPEMPPDDGVPTMPAHAQWYGWMVERGATLMRQERIREWAEEGAPLPAPPLP